MEAEVKMTAIWMDKKNHMAARSEHRSENLGGRSEIAQNGGISRAEKLLRCLFRTFWDSSSSTSDFMFRFVIIF